MTPFAFIFGAGLFLILLFLLMFVLSAQTSPQSVMLEEVARERRLRRQARGAEAAYSSVYLEWLAKPLTLLRRFFAKTPDPNVTRRLALAGYRQTEHADVFLGARLAAPVVLGTLVAVTFKDGAFLFFIIAVVLGFFAPDFWVAEAIKRRRIRIGTSLPDALDLMSICMDAGLSLDQAIVRVGQELRITHPDISQELLQINFEQRAGVPRIESWKAFAERIKVDSLTQFVAMLVQTERFGTPLGTALTSFSDALRTERRQKAEELGAKAAIKLIFPMVLFIFPTVFIVLIGPAIVGLLRHVVTLLE
jgi:tight adherence protein C